jgi:putative transcriptional regulator
MSTVRITIDADSEVGRIDPARVDATSEADIALQIAKDEADSFEVKASLATPDNGPD